MFCAVFLSVAVAATHRGRLRTLGREIGWPGLLMSTCFATASTCFIMALIKLSSLTLLLIFMKIHKTK